MESQILVILPESFHNPLNRFIDILTSLLLAIILRTYNFVYRLSSWKLRHFENLFPRFERLDRTPFVFPTSLLLFRLNGSRRKHPDPLRTSEFGLGDINRLDSLRFLEPDLQGRLSLLPSFSDLLWVSTFPLPHASSNIIDPIFGLAHLSFKNRYELQSDSSDSDQFFVNPDIHDELPLNHNGDLSLSLDIRRIIVPRYGLGPGNWLVGNSFLGERFDDPVLSRIVKQVRPRFRPIPDKPSLDPVSLPLWSSDLASEESFYLRSLVKSYSPASDFYSWLFVESPFSPSFAPWRLHLNLTSMEYGPDEQALRRGLSWEFRRPDFSTYFPTDLQLEYIMDRSSFTARRDNFFTFFHYSHRNLSIKNPIYAYLFTRWIFDELSINLKSSRNRTFSRLSLPFGESGIPLTGSTLAHSVSHLVSRYHKPFSLPPSITGAELLRSQRLYLRSAFQSAQLDLDRLVLLFRHTQLFAVFNIHSLLLDPDSLTAQSVLPIRSLPLLQSALRARFHFDYLRRQAVFVPFSTGWPGSPSGGPLSWPARRRFDRLYADFQFGGLSPLSPYNLRGSDQFTPRFGPTFRSYFSPDEFYTSLGTISPSVRRLLEASFDNPFPDQPADHRLSMDRGNIGDIDTPPDSPLISGRSFSSRYPDLLRQLSYYYNRDVARQTPVVSSNFRFFSSKAASWWIVLGADPVNLGEGRSYSSSKLAWPNPLTSLDFDFNHNPGLSRYLPFSLDGFRNLFEVELIYAYSKYFRFEMVRRRLSELSHIRHSHSIGQTNPSKKIRLLKLPSLGSLFPSNSPSPLALLNSMVEIFWGRLLGLGLLLQAFALLFRPHCAELFSDLCECFNLARLDITSKFMGLVRPAYRVRWSLLSPSIFILIGLFFSRFIWAWLIVPPFSFLSLLFFGLQDPVSLLPFFLPSYVLGDGTVGPKFCIAEELALLYAVSTFLDPWNLFVRPSSLEPWLSLGTYYSFNRALLTDDLRDALCQSNITIDEHSASPFFSFFEPFFVPGPVSLILSFFHTLYSYTTFESIADIIFSIPFSDSGEDSDDDDAIRIYDEPVHLLNIPIFFVLATVLNSILLLSHLLVLCVLIISFLLFSLYLWVVVRFLASVSNLLGDVVYTFYSHISLDRAGLIANIERLSSSIRSKKLGLSRTVTLVDFRDRYLDPNFDPDIYPRGSRIFHEACLNSPLGYPKKVNRLTFLLYVAPLALSPDKNQPLPDSPKKLAQSLDVSGPLDRYLRLFFAPRFHLHSNSLSMAKRPLNYETLMHYGSYIPPFSKPRSPIMSRTGDYGLSSHRSASMDPSHTLSHLESIADSLGWSLDRLMVYLEGRSPSLVKELRQFVGSRQSARPRSTQPSYSNVKTRPSRPIPDTLGGTPFVNPDSLASFSASVTLSPSNYNLSDALFEVALAKISDLRRFSSVSVDGGIAHFLFTYDMHGDLSKILIDFLNERRRSGLFRGRWYIHSAPNDIPWFEDPSYGCTPEFLQRTVELYRDRSGSQVSFKDLVRRKSGLPPKSDPFARIRFTPRDRGPFKQLYRSRTPDPVSFTQVFQPRSVQISHPPDPVLFVIGCGIFVYSFYRFLLSTLFHLVSREAMVALSPIFYGYFVKLRERSLWFKLLISEISLEIYNYGGRFGSESHYIQAYEESLDSEDLKFTSLEKDHAEDPFSPTEEAELWWEDDDEDLGNTNLFIALGGFLMFYHPIAFPNHNHPVEEFSTFMLLLVHRFTGLFLDPEIVAIRIQTLHVKLAKTPYIVLDLCPPLPLVSKFPNLFMVAFGLISPALFPLLLLGVFDPIIFPWTSVVLPFLFSYIKPSVFGLYFIWLSLILLFVFPQFFPGISHQLFGDSYRGYYLDGYDFSDDLDDFNLFVEDSAIYNSELNFVYDWLPDPHDGPEGYSNRLVYRDVSSSERVEEYGAGESFDLHDRISSAQFEEPFTEQQYVYLSSQGEHFYDRSIYPDSDDESVFKNTLRQRRQEFHKRSPRDRYVHVKPRKAPLFSISLWRKLLLVFYKASKRFLQSRLSPRVSDMNLLFVDHLFYLSAYFHSDASEGVKPYTDSYYSTFITEFFYNEVHKRGISSLSFSYNLSEDVISLLKHVGFTSFGDFERELKIDALFAVFELKDPIAKLHLDHSRELALSILRSSSSFHGKLTKDEIARIEYTLRQQEISGSEEHKSVQEFVYWANTPTFSSAHHDDPEFEDDSIPLIYYLIILSGFAYESHATFNSELEVNRSIHLSAFYSRLTPPEKLEFSRSRVARSANGINYDGFSKRYYRNLTEARSMKSVYIEKYSHDINLYPYYGPFHHPDNSFYWNSSVPRLMRIQSHDYHQFNLFNELTYPHVSEDVLPYEDVYATGLVHAALAQIIRVNPDVYPQSISISPPLNHIPRRAFIYPSHLEKVPFLNDYIRRSYNLGHRYNSDSVDAVASNSLKREDRNRLRAILFGLSDPFANISMTRQAHSRICHKNPNSRLALQRPIHDSPLARYSMQGGAPSIFSHRLSFFRKNSYYHDLLRSAVVPGGPFVRNLYQGDSFDPVLGRVYHPPIHLTPVRTRAGFLSRYLSIRHPFDMTRLVRLDEFKNPFSPENMAAYDDDIRTASRQLNSSDGLYRVGAFGSPIPSKRLPYYVYDLQTPIKPLPFLAYNRRRLSPYLKNSNNWLTMDRIGNFPSLSDFSRSSSNFYGAGLPNYLDYGMLNAFEHEPLKHSRFLGHLLRKTRRLGRFDTNYSSNGLVRGRRFDPYAKNYIGAPLDYRYRTHNPKFLTVPKDPEFSAPMYFPAEIYDTRRPIRSRAPLHYQSHDFRYLPDEDPEEGSSDEEESTYYLPTNMDFRPDSSLRGSLWTTYKMDLFRRHVMRSSNRRRRPFPYDVNAIPTNQSPPGRYHYYVPLSGPMPDDYFKPRVSGRAAKSLKKNSFYIDGYARTARWGRDPQLLRLGLTYNRVSAFNPRITFESPRLDADICPELSPSYRFDQYLRDRPFSTLPLVRRRFLGSLRIAKLSWSRDLSHNLHVDSSVRISPRFRYSYNTHLLQFSRGIPPFAERLPSRRRLMSQFYDPRVPHYHRLKKRPRFRKIYQKNARILDRMEDDFLEKSYGAGSQSYRPFFKRIVRPKLMLKHPDFFGHLTQSALQGPRSDVGGFLGFLLASDQVTGSVSGPNDPYFKKKRKKKIGLLSNLSYDSHTDLLLRASPAPRSRALRHVNFIDPLFKYGRSYNSGLPRVMGRSPRIGYMDPYPIYGSLITKRELYGPHRSLVERSALSSRIKVMRILNFDLDNLDIKTPWSDSLSSYTTKYSGEYSETINPFIKPGKSKFLATPSHLRGRVKALGAVHSSSKPSSLIPNYLTYDWPRLHGSQSFFRFAFSLSHVGIKKQPFTTPFLKKQAGLRHTTRSYDANLNVFLPRPVPRTTLLIGPQAIRSIENAIKPPVPSESFRRYSGPYYSKFSSQVSLRGSPHMGSHGREDYVLPRYRAATDYDHLEPTLKNDLTFESPIIERNRNKKEGDYFLRRVTAYEKALKRRSLKLRSHRYLSDTSEFPVSNALDQGRLRPFHGRFFNSPHLEHRRSSFLNSFNLSLFGSIFDFLFFTYTNFLDFYNIYYLFGSLFSVVLLSPIVISFAQVLWLLLLKPLVFPLSFIGVWPLLLELFSLASDLLTFLLELVLWLLR